MLGQLCIQFLESSYHSPYIHITKPNQTLPPTHLKPETFKFYFKKISQFHVLCFQFALATQFSSSGKSASSDPGLLKEMLRAKEILTHSEIDKKLEQYGPLPVPSPNKRAKKN